MSNKTTVLFIHGTGTRETGYRSALAEIRKNLPQDRVEGLYWGGTLGTDLHFDGASVPGYHTTRGIIAESLTDDVDSPSESIESEAQAMVWEQLERDPLFEFRQLCSVGIAGPVPGASQPPALVALSQSLHSTASGREFMGLLLEGDLQQQFDASVEAISEAAALRLVLVEDVPSRLSALARATVATMLVLPGATNTIDETLDAVAQDVLQRDLWVGLLADHLHELMHSPETRGVVAFAKHAFDDLVIAPFLWSAAHVVTWRARKRRRSLTDGSSAAMGDILWYQAHGRHLREEIAKCVAGYSKEGPVILLGHSLGGIACVETLIEQSPPGVKLLITAGSQAPYFYEIGVLATKPLPPRPRTALPHALPDTFPRWLNFYDPRDLLSYIVRPILATPGAEAPTDHQLDNGCSFPASHGGYWRNAELWKVARPLIEAI